CLRLHFQKGPGFVKSIGHPREIGSESKQMFKKTRASSSTMSEVEIRHVTDELTAMRRKLPEGYDEYKSYATEMTAMQSIPSVMGRRQFHALLLDGNFRPDRALPVRTKSSEMALRMLIGSADIAI